MLFILLKIIADKGHDLFLTFMFLNVDIRVWLWYACNWINDIDATSSLFTIIFKKKKF